MTMRRYRCAQAGAAALLAALTTHPAAAADAEHGKALYAACVACHTEKPEDRKSTRLNSSHIQKSRMPSSA